MKRITPVIAAAVIAGFVSVPAIASPARDSIIAGIKAEAKATDPSFSGFSAERGKAFFEASQSGGKPATPSCTSCHGKTPFATGQTRAGKIIEPMAVSKTPARFTDPEKVGKWFRRNCNSVLGRECTAVEKGDYLIFMMSQ